MRVVVVCPKYNGLYMYIKPLIKEMKNRGIDVVHVGFKHICFDNDKIMNKVYKMVQRIEKLQPDIIHFNYGTYDAEQLLPYYCRNIKAKKIYTVHSIQVDLFKKTNNERLDRLSNEYMKKMDAYCYFTKYAITKFDNNNKPYTIAYHPATNQFIKLNDRQINKFFKDNNIENTNNSVTLLGYASHWKDLKPFVYLVERLPYTQFILGGPYWKDKLKKECPEFNESEHSNLKIVNYELTQEEITSLMNLGVGMFPYHQFQSFQGSGQLPNYLYSGIKCLVGDFEPMREYADKNCVLFDMTDLKGLESKMTELLSDKTIVKNNKFSYENHLDNILKVYGD